VADEPETRARVIVEHSDGVAVIEGSRGTGAYELLQQVAGEIASGEHMRGEPPYRIVAERVPADTPMMTGKLVRKATGGKHG
jgi:hypothetical protein